MPYFKKKKTKNKNGIFDMDFTLKIITNMEEETGLGSPQGVTPEEHNRTIRRIIARINESSESQYKNFKEIKAERAPSFCFTNPKTEKNTRYLPDIGIYEKKARINENDKLKAIIEVELFRNRNNAYLKAPIYLSRSNITEYLVYLYDKNIWKKILLGINGEPIDIDILYSKVFENFLLSDLFIDLQSFVTKYHKTSEEISKKRTKN